ncbi:hypothetical protein NDU88_001950 [Pleurodeles waltl]|uniref:Uncharacterized protein n=1 Tax=Pleurodeles waltl TaxID=8319 RepID=A0AAV7U7Y8_PLEWA|nr:hypothetical protein NDU88_001950 [Pleurodeles waltl]
MPPPHSWIKVPARPQDIYLPAPSAVRDPAVGRLLLRCARSAWKPPRQPRRDSSVFPSAGHSARESALRHGTCRAAPASTAILAARSAQSFVGVRTPPCGNSQLTRGTISQGAHRGS